MAKYGNKRVGIYRSIFESKVAAILTERGVVYEYEKKVFTLMESFTYSRWERARKKFIKVTNIRKITYTPDFTGDGWVIEVKGKATADFKVRWKLFLQYLYKNEVDLKVFLLTNIKDLDEVIKVIQDETDKGHNNNSSGPHSTTSKRRSKKQK